MPTIMVVEDNEYSRDALARRLERRGYRDRRGDRTASRRSRWRAPHVPDLILMDLGLPIIDGWEATRQLKEDAATRHIPIIVLSAHAMTNDRELALAAGRERVRHQARSLCTGCSRRSSRLLKQKVGTVTRTGSLLVVDDNEANRDALSRRLRQPRLCRQRGGGRRGGAGARRDAEVRPRPAGRRDARHERTRGPEPASRQSLQYRAPGDHGHGQNGRRRHRRGLSPGRERLRDQAGGFSRGARADRHARVAQMGGRSSPRQRRALCARRSRRQRRAVGLESDDERRLLVAALEGDARLRGVGDLGDGRRNGSRACIPTIATASRRRWRRTSRMAAGTSRASIGSCTATRRSAGCSAAARRSGTATGRRRGWPDR